MSPRDDETTLSSLPGELGAAIERIGTGPHLVTTQPPREELSCARCAARWPRPGPCDWCAARIPPQPPGPEELSGRCRVIPARFRGVSWDNAASLRNDDQAAPRPRVAAPDLARIRAAMKGSRRIVVLGPGGSGKSTLAAAWLRGAIAAGFERCRWFGADQLLANEPLPSRPPSLPPKPQDMAVAAEVLVLDDLGFELEGAAPGSGLLAQRMGACARVICERHDREKVTLVTTGFDLEDRGQVPGIRSLYGDRVARRVFEGAAFVRLGGSKVEGANKT